MFNSRQKDANAQGGGGNLVISRIILKLYNFNNTKEIDPDLGTSPF
jgi:hypothetical protein